MEQQLKYFFPFSDLSRFSASIIRDCRCWVLDNVAKEDADIFAWREGESQKIVGSKHGIAFRNESDYLLFVLTWA